MIRVAAIQMVSGGNLEANLGQARELIGQAAEQGAKLVVLPENFALFDTSAMQEAGRREAEQGVVQSFLSQQARDHGVWLLGGSTPCAQRPDGQLLEERVRSTCWVFDDQGQVVGRYDKIHLFDVEVEDGHGRYCESQIFEPGEEPLLVETPWGKLGVAICYDLRFPELFRHLRELGAEMIALPAAFTQVTGEAHWHVLLRARAIENQCFVIASGQGGWHSERRQTYGHSLIIDPWGLVLAEHDTGPGVVVADLQPARLEEVRRRMPVQQHRRL